LRPDEGGHGTARAWRIHGTVDVLANKTEPAVNSDPTAIDRLAEQIRVALQSADLDAYEELLDPDVSWGPPDDQVSGCHNRSEVLAWYRRGRDSGVRAEVVETVVSKDTILVGLKVRGSSGEADGSDELDRWQVLTIFNGRVKDIRGFEDRDEAVARMK
jgi:hypothetical protein